MRGKQVHVPIDPPYTDREGLMLKTIERQAEEIARLKLNLQCAEIGGVTEKQRAAE